MEKTNKYDVRKAGNRLLWRFTHKENGEIKAFKPNETDIEALKTVLGWITSFKKENLLKQRLLAKLYIYNYTDFMRKYDSTILQNEIQKDLSRILSMPLDTFYDAFYRDLTNRQFEKIALNTLNISGKELTNDDLKNIYSKDFVFETLANQITEAVNRFNNLD